MQAQFKVKDRVIDQDGNRGRILEVTEYDGSVWYDVRLGPDADVLRYQEELRADDQ